MTTARVQPPPRIVVGVDGSEQSKLALRWAARFAELFDARVDAIAAWHYPVGWGWNAMAADMNLAGDMEKLLTEEVDEVIGADPKIEVRISIQEGNAAHVLLHEADGALMVVVGSRGHGGFAGLLLGSVSSAVAEHATCPVFVVHGDEVPVFPAAVAQ